MLDRIRDNPLLFAIEDNYMGSDARKPVFQGFAKNKGANQPAHLRSLISVFVICFLESIICKLATGKIVIF